MEKKNLEINKVLDKQVIKSKPAETVVEDISIIELSTKKTVGKKKDEFAICKTEKKNSGVKKNLSKVEDWVEFDFRANKSKAIANEVVAEVKAEKPEVKTDAAKVVSDKKETAPKTCKQKVKATVKKEETVKVLSSEAKSEDDVLVQDKTSSASLKIKDENLERQAGNLAQACDLFCFDDNAKMVVNIARAGALFDCVKSF